MKKYNISTNLMQVIKDLDNKATSAVLFNGSIEDWFRTTVGVRQGCLLSPTLFSQYSIHSTRLKHTCSRYSRHSTSLKHSSSQYSRHSTRLKHTSSQCSPHSTRLKYTSSQYSRHSTRMKYTTKLKLTSSLCSRQ